MKRLIAIILVLSVAMGVLACFVGCSEADNTKSSGDWKYLEKEDGTISLVSYIGSNAHVVVPATLEGKTVSSIEGGLFMSVNDGSSSRRLRDVYQNNEVVETVEFAAPVTAIPERTFYLCNKLTSVTLPDTCESIGDFAFYGCSALTRIDIPTACTSIGAYCFRQCDKLADVYIHNSADATMPPKIGDKCFYLVDSKSSKEDQYYIIPDLRITVYNIAVFDETVILEERKKNHTNDYKYWLEYMTAEDNRVFAMMD